MMEAENEEYDPHFLIEDNERQTREFVDDLYGPQWSIEKEKHFYTSCCRLAAGIAKTTGESIEDIRLQMKRPMSLTQRAEALQVIENFKNLKKAAAARLDHLIKNPPTYEAPADLETEKSHLRLIK